VLRAAYRMGGGGASVEFPIPFPIRTWLTAWRVLGRLGIVFGAKLIRHSSSRQRADQGGDELDGTLTTGVIDAPASDGRSGKTAAHHSQVASDDAPADPALQAGFALVATATQAMLAFEHADAPFDTGMKAPPALTSSSATNPHSQGERQRPNRGGAGGTAGNVLRASHASSRLVIHSNWDALDMDMPFYITPARIRAGSAPGRSARQAAWLPPRYPPAPQS